MVPDLIEHYASGLVGASETEIERMLGKIALLFPGVKLTDLEAETRLDLYVDLLGDIPFDCLSVGFREVAKASRFFPTVAEIREHAEPMFAKRRARYYGLKSLLKKHQEEWTPPWREDDRCSPEQAAAILRDLEVGRFARK